MSDAYSIVIGLEVHCQLATRTKLFCGCTLAFGADPNSHVCPVCLGMPGAMPVCNAKAVEFAALAGLAVQGDVQASSTFARKNYFYPDLPKGYQVTQFDRPIVQGGGVTIDVGDAETKRIPLTRIHLEEDAGKSIHRDDGRSEVDFNRAGTPLIEVVSEPDIRTADEAVAYLKELRNLVRYLGVCDGHMEQGSYRCDANVSLRKSEDDPLGTRVELKNLNSFNHVRRALNYEIERQAAELDAGKAIVQETRLWDENAGRTRSMRSKEEAHDYRYFPEPDLLPVTVDPTLLATLAAAMPKLPRARRDHYQDELGLSRYDADVLVAEKGVSDYFDAVIATGADPKVASNWVTSELKGRLNTAGRCIEDSPISAQDLGEILTRLQDQKLSGKMAKDVFSRAYNGEKLADVLADVGEQVTDSSAIEATAKAVIAAHPGEVEEYRGGKKKVLGFFIGQVMKSTGGKANPLLVKQVVQKELDA